jgi:hypothetical protein
MVECYWSEDYRAGKSTDRPLCRQGKSSKGNPGEVTAGLGGSRTFKLNSPMQEKRIDVVGDDIKGNPAVIIDGKGR